MNNKQGESRIVKWIFESCAAGMSLREIAEKLNAKTCLALRRQHPAMPATSRKYLKTWPTSAWVFAVGGGVRDRQYADGMRHHDDLIDRTRSVIDKYRIDK